MTLRLEGNVSKSGYGSLWQTLVNLQYLWHELQEMKFALADESDQSFIKNATEYGIQKLTTYFKLLVLTPPVLSCCVATTLNPRLRLLWFKDKWAQFPDGHKKAERSIKEVFQRYLNAEEDDDIEVSEIRRRKTPGGNYHDDAFEGTMSVNLHLQTGNRVHK